MHIPVLAQEAIRLLVTDPSGTYVDATVGSGGHSRLILSRLNKAGRLIAFDRDKEALFYAKRNLASVDQEQVVFRHANFVSLESELASLNIRRVNGILFDLGLSSLQVDSKVRGFSFRFDAPLDMRFDQEQGLTAADLVNSGSRRELAGIFREYGEERRAEVFAKRVVEARKAKKGLGTTYELIRALGLPLGGRGHQHPATKVFMALRIAVNNELVNLKEVLPQSLRALKPSGRLVVISFHSLEDRLIKNFFKEEEKKGEIKILTKKVIKPTFSEIKENPRARSAKLRAVEKIAY